jgi:hypothetical protein
MAYWGCGALCRSYRSTLHGDVEASGTPAKSPSRSVGLSTAFRITARTNYCTVDPLVPDHPPSGEDVQKAQAAISGLGDDDVRLPRRLAGAKLQHNTGFVTMHQVRELERMS